MQDFASRQRQPQRHALGMVLVVLLHLLLFWVIQSGLSRAVIQKSPGGGGRAAAGAGQAQAPQAPITDCP